MKPLVLYYYGGLSMPHDLYVMRRCVYDYLRYIRDLDTSIREIESRIRSIRSRLEGMGVSFDKVGSAPSMAGDTMADSVAKIMELEEEWADRIEAHYTEINSARDLCDPTHTGRWSLWMHIVEGRTWVYVGRVIGYSEAQTRRIAEGGIRELYYIIPEQFRREAFPNAMPQ